MKIFCSHTDVVDIDSLVANPRNTNEHPEQQIKMLAKIMNHQGWRNPIVVSNRSGFMTKGHGRLLAAKLNGWTTVPIDRQDYASEADEWADMIADNKIAELAESNEMRIQEIALDLGPDFDFDLFGIPDFKVIGIDTLPPGCDEDAVPSVPAEATTRLGDIYKLGNHRLLCGDSTSIDAVERLMDGERAELCFTSPPYSDQREYGGGLELSTERIASFIRAAYSKAEYFAVNLGYSRKNGEVNAYWDDYIKEARDCGLKLLSWNIWNKGECGSIGNQTAMFAINHEWIFVFGTKPKDLNLTIENKNAKSLIDNVGIRQRDGSVKKGKDVTIRSHSQLRTIYDCPPQKARDDIDHPARFSIEFPQGYIEAMTNRGGIVYEPFTGSGTTIIAAEKLDRRCFGMELDPKYCDVIVSRWEQYTGKQAILLSGALQDEQ